MSDYSRPSKLYIWKSSHIFIASTPLPICNYYSGWDQLLISLKGHFCIQRNGETVFTKSCVIKSGTRVTRSRVDISESVFAVICLEPALQHYDRFKHLMTMAENGIYYGHPNESCIIDCLHIINENNLDLKHAFFALQTILIAGSFGISKPCSIDVRVVKTLRSIHSHYRKNVAIDEYARCVHLSKSRLEKLFKKQLGIPITKYRLRYRIGIGVFLLAGNYSITDAAHASGFSNAAHFSRSFKQMIGIQPSAIFLKPPFTNVYIQEELIDACRKLKY